MLNQTQIKSLSVATQVELEALKSNGVGNRLYCLCAELETLYRYETSGLAFLVDNTSVLTTGDGGNTRWVGIGGTYIYGIYPSINQFTEKLNVTSDDGIDTVPAKKTLKEIIVTNTGSASATIDFGTTSGDDDLAQSVVIAADGKPNTVVIEKTFSTTVAQDIYVSSADWTDVNLNFSVNYETTCDTI